ncbi:hypothetical protein [Streptomyces sp. NPDC001292]
MRHSVTTQTDTAAAAGLEFAGVVAAELDPQRKPGVLQLARLLPAG